MKKISFLELFLYFICLICFIIAMTCIYGAFSNIGTLLFPDNISETSEYFSDSVIYVKRSLFSQIPMTIISGGIFFYSLKLAIKERTTFKIEKEDTNKDIENKKD